LIRDMGRLLAKDASYLSDKITLHRIADQRPNWGGDIAAVSPYELREKLPLVRHLDKHELRAREALFSYGGTLQEDRRNRSSGSLQMRYMISRRRSAGG
jgi:hypothetical protein